MTVHIAIGWWLAPAMVTAVAWLWALWPRADERPSGGMFDWHWLPGLFRCFAALPASLSAWLVWSLLR